MSQRGIKWRKSNRTNYALPLLFIGKSARFAGVDFRGILHPGLQNLCSVLYNTPGHPGIQRSPVCITIRNHPTPTADGLLKTSPCLPFLPAGNRVKNTYAGVVQCPPTLTPTRLSSPLLRSPPLGTGPRGRFESTPPLVFVSIGPAFVAASVQALLPLSRPSSKTLQIAAISASAVTLKGRPSTRTTGMLMKLSLTETGPTISNRPFRFLNKASLWLLAFARSPARAQAPIATRPLFTLVRPLPAPGVSAHPLSSSDGIYILPSSTFSPPHFSIKSRSCVMQRRPGLSIRCASRSAFTCNSACGSYLVVCARPLQSLAIWSSLFLVVNWAVNAALVPGPVLIIDKLFLYGVSNSNRPVTSSTYSHPLTMRQIAPACTFPVLVLVIYDWPRDRPNAYQIVLAVAIWCWYVP
jgi:hypothetical protein